MSEFTHHKTERLEKLHRIFTAIREGKNVKPLYETHRAVIESCVPSDVIYLVHELVEQQIPMPELKTGINKLLNLLYKTIVAAPVYQLAKNSFLKVLQQNNAAMQKRLEQLKPLIKTINSNPEDRDSKEKAAGLFADLQIFESYYAIKENVLFPLIEKHLPEFRCLSVMWSFHDDIRRNLKNAVQELKAEKFNIKHFNRFTGDLFFTMNAIRFREERILYPLVAEIIPAKELNNLFFQAVEIGFPYFQPEGEFKQTTGEPEIAGKINLGTGTIDAEQIKLIFNHLPVDITFVDENNKVRFYSTPPNRIFRRTNAILGRDVHNCHPPESVHVVEQIVEAFREGKKDSASFWIEMNGQKLLIQYFAVRNEEGDFKGVVEVSQEITEIQKLTGEKRLLDWE